MEENNCELCGQPIGDFNDNGIYEGKYCEDCFYEAQESRLGQKVNKDGLFYVFNIYNFAFYISTTRTFVFNILYFFGNI